MSNKKNTSAVSTTLQYTLTEAVTEAVNTLKSNGSFTAHDLTVAVREAVNEGEYTLPGFENPDTTSTIKYLVKHYDVKSVVDLLLNDGTLVNLGLSNVDYSGQARVFNFDVSASDVAVGDDTTVVDDAATDDDADVVDTDSPVNQRIKNYLSNVGSATAKQIQSTLKVNGLTSKQIVELADELGYTVTPGTEGAYSTYTVSEA